MNDYYKNGRAGSRGYVQLNRKKTQPRIIDLLWKDQCEWHRMTSMTGPDYAVVCNLIDIHASTRTQYYIFKVFLLVEF